MKGFDSNFIDELKRKSDIVDIASKYVRLEQRGGNFWGCCPFHHEKTASFCINSIGQFYYCYGCHKSGDVITLVMELESLDFSDTVKYLAEKANLKLPEIRVDDEKIKESKKKKETALEILKETAKYYCSVLRSNSGEEHRKYIAQRNLSGETVNKFGIGASKDYESLNKHLTEKGYLLEDAYLCGVLGKSEKGTSVRYYDALAGRLIIPVIDQFNNVIAFCGRIIEKKENVGKYVNTRETFVFSKGKTLFNLNNLKKLKNEKGIDGVIVVEGHMDVISLTQAGFLNVVASMGTALTKDHARILKRYAEKIYICYDGDAAGKNATVRGLEILQAEGLEVKVVSLPDGEDPDEVIVKRGKEGYQKCLDQAKPLIDFKLDLLGKTYDVKTVDGKRKYVVQAIKVIKESPSVSEQEDLLKQVRDKTGITYESLKRELENIDDKKPVENANVPKFNDNAGDKTAIASRFVLASYLFNKPWTSGVKLAELSMTLPVHEKIKNFILEKQNTKLNFSDLYEEMEEIDQEELGRIAGLEIDDKNNFDKERYFDDCVKTLKKDFITKEIDRLTKLFSVETDTEKRKQIAKDMGVMLKTKNKL